MFIHLQGVSRSTGVGVVEVENEGYLRAWVAQIESDHTP